MTAKLGKFSVVTVAHENDEIALRHPMTTGSMSFEHYLIRDHAVVKCRDELTAEIYRINLDEARNTAFFICQWNYAQKRSEEK